MGVILGAFPAQAEESPAGAGQSGPLKGFDIYVPVPYVSQMQFVVIETQNYKEDGFDFYLRDELEKIGFPKGLTKAQLARVYVDAGVAESAPYVTDPMAMRSLSDVVGPFLRLRVDYRDLGFFIAYDVELWDVRSASPVLVMRGEQVNVWRPSSTLGKKVLRALDRWRRDSLMLEKSAGSQDPRSET